MDTTIEIRTPDLPLVPIFVEIRETLIFRDFGGHLEKGRGRACAQKPFLAHLYPHI